MYVFPASPLSVHNSLFIYCQYNHIKSAKVAENPHVIFRAILRHVEESIGGIINKLDIQKKKKKKKNL